jgi:hypothetical protein
VLSEMRLEDGDPQCRTANSGLDSCLNVTGPRHC